jgi:ferredoxin
MTHVITNLCLRDGACVEVCPVDCIVPGDPVDGWPTFYINPIVCINCSACEPECPHGAIMPGADIPSSYEARGGEVLSMPVGSPGFDTPYQGEDDEGNSVSLSATRVLKQGEIIDLTPAIKTNADFFKR